MKSPDRPPSSPEAEKAAFRRSGRRESHRSLPARPSGAGAAEGKCCHRRAREPGPGIEPLCLCPRLTIAVAGHTGRPGPGPELSPSGHLSPGSPRGQLSPQSGKQPICTVSAASCCQVTAKNTRYRRQPVWPTSAPLTEAGARSSPGTQGLPSASVGRVLFFF